MILNSWKEIASYLGCSVRTAQRLEHDGMPVRRPAGHSRSAVLAFTDEIDLWLKSAKVEHETLPTVYCVRREGLLRLSAQLSALRQQIAECRERSTTVRQQAITIRGRLPFKTSAASVQPETVPTS